jgi:predicted Zn-dependent protease
LVLCALVAALGGCQSIASWKGSAKDGTLDRKTRRAEIVARVNHDRDLAEFQAAQSSYQQGDLRGCRAVLEPLLKRNPGHIEGNLLLAEMLVADNRCQEAIGQLQPLAEQHPEHAQLQHAMGLLWDNAGDTRRALGYYERAAQQEPENEGYQLSYRTAARAVTATLPVGPAAPIAATDPTRPFASGVQLVGHEESAEPAAFAVSNEEPGSAVADGSEEVSQRLSTAVDTLRHGDVDEAKRLLETLVAENPRDPQIPISAAVAALECNQPDIAIALVNPALSRFPESAALYRILGTANYRRGDYPASQIALQQALSLDNTSALSYFLMGCTLTKLGQAEAAEEHYERARQLDPRFAVHP